MTLDNRGRKAAAAVHEAVRAVSPVRVPAPSRVRPMLRYAPSFAIIALIITGALVLRALPDRTRFTGPAGALQATFTIASTLDDLSAMTYSSGNLWVVNASKGQLVRIDTRANRIVATLEIGQDPKGVAVGFGAAWVANYGSRDVSRVDIATNRVTKIRVGAYPTGIAAGEGAIWVATLDGEVLRIDPASRTITRRYPPDVPSSGKAIAVAGGYVWRGSVGPDGIVRIDIRTGESKRISVFGEVAFHATRDGKALWIAEYGQFDGVSRYDTATVERTHASGVIGNVLAVFGGEVWGLSSEQSDLVRLDPETAQPAERFAISSSVSGLAIGANSLWVSTIQGTVLRLSLG